MYGGPIQPQSAPLPKRLAFGELLRRHRLATGLTQEALAERAGVSARGIQGLERGASHPQQGTLRRLTGALALSPEQRAAFEAAGQPVPRRSSGRAARLSAVPGPLAGPEPPPATPVPPATRSFDERSDQTPDGQNPDGEMPNGPAMAAPTTARRNNLPAPLTTFVGRAAQVAEVRRLLLTARLLTLTGAGGIGLGGLS